MSELRERGYFSDDEDIDRLYRMAETVSDILEYAFWIVFLTSAVAVVALILAVYAIA